MTGNTKEPRALGHEVIPSVLLACSERETVRHLSTCQSFRVATATSGQEALTRLNQEEISVLVADQRLPDMSGVDLLARVAHGYPGAARILSSVSGDSASLLDAVDHGYAHEFLIRPWTTSEFEGCLDRGLTVIARRRHLLAKTHSSRDVALREPFAVTKSFLVGQDGGLKDVCALARRAAKTSANVIVFGETGTGKELIARFIHDQSPRAGRAFVAVNCAAIPDGLLESELFGHEQGAYTGAYRARVGRFQLAHGGTLFLDEVGDITPRLQAALLRVLQERKVERLGSASALDVDIRIVAATHRNLEGLVAAGQFREDSVLSAQRCADLCEATEGTSLGHSALGRALPKAVVATHDRPHEIHTRSCRHRGAGFS
ncbi:MAG: sigma-54-dependent Fis family transcriptional regulator [Polyangiaceae bacterium]